MRCVRFSLAAIGVLLLATAATAQEKTVAERLGYPADAKLLILHADDLAVAHAQDAASFDALDRRAVSSASIIVPCPWLTEVADYAKAHPEADLGLHLALTSEWKTYRWGPVAPKDKVPSLLDPSGYLPMTTEEVVRNAKPAEVEIELRAQIERALAMGIRPTHFDSHMGALFSKPELFSIYVRLAHEYHLPFFIFKVDSPQYAPLYASMSEKDKALLMQTTAIANPSVPVEGWKEFYAKAIQSLKPGLNEMIVHLAYDDSEMRAVTIGFESYGAAWRQRDYNIVTSPEFKEWLAQNNVTLIHYRDLAKLLN